MAAGVAAGASKTICKDATFEIAAKHSLDIRRWRVHVALPVKLVARGEPGFEVIGDGAIKQTLFRMTGSIQRWSWLDLPLTGRAVACRL
jgi:hypothetical protein